MNNRIGFSQEEEGEGGEEARGSDAASVLDLWLLSVKKKLILAAGIVFLFYSSTLLRLIRRVNLQETKQRMQKTFTVRL